MNTYIDVFNFRENERKQLQIVIFQIKLNLAKIASMVKCSA